MTLWQIIALALLQGLTEFLPISSWAHLILFPKITGLTDQGLAFDVSVHVGTLSAVVFYFRKDLIRMAGEWFGSLGGKPSTSESRLAWGVILGTIPVGIAGLALNQAAEEALRSPQVIAATTIGFGVVLLWADLSGRRSRDEHTLSLKDALLIGLAQALALIPGTSRSGITITAGLFLGLTRKGAARFSFLLSIPLILLAGGLETVKMLQGPAFQAGDLFLGAVVSGISAYLCIHFFLRLLDRIGLWPFAVYRFVLGIFLLSLFGFSSGG